MVEAFVNITLISVILHTFFMLKVPSNLPKLLVIVLLVLLFCLIRLLAKTFSIFFSKILNQNWHQICFFISLGLNFQYRSINCRNNLGMLRRETVLTPVSKESVLELKFWRLFANLSQ